MNECGHWSTYSQSKLILVIGLVFEDVTGLIVEICKKMIIDKITDKVDQFRLYRNPNLRCSFNANTN